MTNEEVIEKLGLPTQDEMKAVLKEAGWHDYYHWNYWVHPDRCEDPANDYTNCGLPIPAAYLCEIEKWPKFKFGPLGAQRYCPEDSKMRELYK